MPTRLTAEHWLKLRWILLIPALFMIHFGVVSVLVALGTEAEVTTQDNSWLSLADAISVGNPELEAALARYDISRGLITAPEYQQARFESALQHWNRAAELRPYWPYYLLGGYEASVRLQQPAGEIQRRLNDIITLAPKERGVDRSMILLSVYVWHKLTPGQQDWLADRLGSSAYATRRYVFEKTDGTIGRIVLCGKLPWDKVKQFCK